MNNKGFTLTELVISVTVLSIISAFAVPSFEKIIRQQQAASQVNMLVSMIFLARSEAVKRNQVITVCKSSDAIDCGGDWSDGWIMFVDHNADGSLSSSENKLGTGKILDNYQLTWSAFGSDNYIRFMKNGLTSSHNGTFKLCPLDDDLRFSNAVIVSKTARARLAKDNDGDGIVEDASGVNLTCP